MYVQLSAQRLNGSSYSAGTRCAYPHTHAYTYTWTCIHRHTLINTHTTHPIPPPQGILSQELNGVGWLTCTKKHPAPYSSFLAFASSWIPRNFLFPSLLASSFYFHATSSISAILKLSMSSNAWTVLIPGLTPAVLTPSSCHSFHLNKNIPFWYPWSNNITEGCIGILCMAMETLPQ
jgi:hypothetical protein